MASFGPSLAAATVGSLDIVEYSLLILRKAVEARVAGGVKRLSEFGRERARAPVIFGLRPPHTRRSRPSFARQLMTATTVERRSTTFLDLPLELTLHIMHLLPPISLVRLSETCHALHEIARSPSIWRDLVCEILRKNASVPNLVSIKHHPDEIEADDDRWWSWASFLLPHSRHLGYWMSSNPYTSRVLRMSAVLAASPESDELQVTLQAHQLIPINRFDSPDYTPDSPLQIPAGCVLDRNRTSYRVPRTSENPDRGLSVDLMDITYDWLQLFSISATSGALLHSSPYSALSPSRFGATLKLRLQDVVTEVKETSETEDDRRRSEADAMYSLFTGRTPVLPWPTPELAQGALRGRESWLHSRGEVQPVLGPPELINGVSTSLGTLEGFTLQIRRQTSVESNSYNPVNGAGSSYPFPVTGNPLAAPQQRDPAAPIRRLGVGSRGGPAVLWKCVDVFQSVILHVIDNLLALPVTSGQEADPDTRVGVATVQAGEGLTFRMPNIPTQRVPAHQDSIREFIGEEIVRTDREEFYGIKSPAGPIQAGDSSNVAPNGEILAASLEGLWVGNYGPHGLEIGYLSLKTDWLESETYAWTSADQRRETRQLARSLCFTKITGDSNVPSGQISFVAMLSPLHDRISQHDDDDDADVEADPASLGTVPSVTNETLLRWSDPTWRARGEEPRWDEATLVGLGRVALSGFVNPSWTTAAVTCIRSSVAVPVGEEMGSVTIVDTVDELRMRWAELGRVGVFKRMRVS